MTEELVKVVFPLIADPEHGHAAELIWASRVGGNRCRLRNSPFYARGVSFNDVVFVVVDGDSQLVFDGVSIRGGHSTYRIALQIPAESDAFYNQWNPLEKIGCSYEGVNGRILAMDVPPSADIYNVFALLEAGETAGVWVFEEGHCGHAFSGSDATSEVK